jgi:hypothetical protein
LVVGFNFTPLPFLLANAGVAVDQIARINSVANSPGVLGLFLAPIVDIKLRRRTWLAIGTFGTALAACLYFSLIGASHLVLMTALIFAGGMVTFLVVAACGGLMVKLLSATDQSKAAAWSQVGLLGGGGLGGAIVLWLVARTPLVVTGICFAVLIALLGIVPFTIPEPAPGPSPWFHGRLAIIGREMRSLVLSRERGWSTLLLLSPCSTGAAQSLLPAIASHYGVSASGVMWTNGIGGSGALSLGAWCGTLIPGLWDRRLTYAAAGVMNAVAAVVLMVANRPSVYVAGTALYLATLGLCWARSVALIVDIIGPEARDPSTLYSILNAAVTIPLLYVIWLDGVGFRHFGTHGLLATDAAFNLAVFAIVASIFIARGMGLRSEPFRP